MITDINLSYYDSIPKPKKDMMEVVGDSSRWLWKVFIQMFLILTLVALHNLSITFLVPNQDHWCTRPQGAANLTVREWKRIGIPVHEQKCYKYIGANVSTLEEEEINNISISRIAPCLSWEYDYSFYSSTVLSKFNLVCKRKWLVSVSKSVFMIGILMSSIIFGHLADRIGRKCSIVIASIITSFFTTVCPFSTNVTIFIIVRFFMGIGLGGYYNTAFMLLMEIVVPEKRSMYGMGVQMGWCFGFICLPGIAWLIRDEFWIQIALAVPSFVLMLLSGLIPESPRWLLSRGKVEEAKKILLRAAETNGNAGMAVEVAIDKVIAEEKQEDESREKTKNLCHLLQRPGLRRITLFLFLIWFINSFIYFGLSFNTNELSGNPFINFALSGLMEFPAYFLSIFLTRSVGRKRPLAASMIVGGIVCLILYLIPEDIPETIVAAAMIGKFAITCSFGILYVFTAEIFPTVVRTIGLGWSTVCEGLGSILAPFIRELAHATHPAVPQFLFGILSIAGGALVVFLPETNNLIPDTLEDADSTPRKKEEKSEILKMNSSIITNGRE